MDNFVLMNVIHLLGTSVVANIFSMTRDILINILLSHYFLYEIIYVICKLL